MKLFFKINGIIKQGEMIKGDIFIDGKKFKRNCNVVADTYNKCKALGANNSYNYCGCCGSTPKTGELPNKAPVKWWDPDDGWKIGTLCITCIYELVDIEPNPKDYAYQNQDQIDIDTDEDPTDAILD